MKVWVRIQSSNVSIYNSKCVWRVMPELKIDLCVFTQYCNKLFRLESQKQTKNNVKQ